MRGPRSARFALLVYAPPTTNRSAGSVTERPAALDARGFHALGGHRAQLGPATALRQRDGPASDGCRPAAGEGRSRFANGPEEAPPTSMCRLGASRGTGPPAAGGERCAGRGRRE